MIPQTIVIRKKQDVDAKIAKVKKPQQFKKNYVSHWNKKRKLFLISLEGQLLIQ
jgi:hypothetical protein